MDTWLQSVGFDNVSDMIGVRGGGESLVLLRYFLLFYSDVQFGVLVGFL